MQNECKETSVDSQRQTVIISVRFENMYHYCRRYVKVPPSDDQWWLTEKDGQTAETNGQDENSDSEKESDSDSGEFVIDCKGQVNGGKDINCLYTYT